MKTFKSISILFTLFLLLSSFSIAENTAYEINSDSSVALAKFHSEIKGSKNYLEKAKGYIIFPDVSEVGLFFGGKYGEGALYTNGKNEGYYSITSASVGFQAGLQTYSLIIVFTSDTALNAFKNDDDWETDMDFNIAMADWNNDEELDDIDFGSNMVGFVFDSTGMMGNFTMEGTRFERITPDID